MLQQSERNAAYVNHKLQDLLFIFFFACQYLNRNLTEINFTLVLKTYSKSFQILVLNYFYH